MPVAAQLPSTSSSSNRPKSSDGSSILPSTSSPPQPENHQKDLFNTPAASDIPPAPELHVNGKPAIAHDTNGDSAPRPSRSYTTGHQPEGGWGSNFWVTLVDPQVRPVFFFNSTPNLSSFCFIFVFFWLFDSLMCGCCMGIGVN